MCCWRSIGSNLTFVKIGGWPQKNTNLHFVPKTENQDLVFYFHFTGLLSQILLSCVIIAQLSDIRDKYIRYEEILRENMILWRKLINESAGIYERGIILVKV